MLTHKSSKWVHNKRRSRDDEQITIRIVLLGAPEEACWQIFSKKDNICMYTRQISYPRRLAFDTSTDLTSMSKSRIHTWFHKSACSRKGISSDMNQILLSLLASCPSVSD